MQLPVQIAGVQRDYVSFYHAEAVLPQATRGVTPSACISATVGGGQACVSIPILGRRCLPAPGVPNLGRVSVCCKIRTKWGIPRGVRCCVRVRGADIYCRNFGL